MILILLKYIAFKVQVIYIGFVWDVVTIQTLMKNKVTRSTLTSKTSDTYFY